MEELDYNEILIRPQQAKKLLLQLYGIEGEVSPLPGEYDMNFRVRVDNKDAYVLKISRPEEAYDTLEFQQELLQHLSQNRYVLAPIPVQDLSSKNISEIKDDYHRLRFVRLLTWIPGRMYHEVNPKRRNLRHSLGTSCGKLTKALEHFDHANAHRTFEWDLANSLWTCDHLALFSQEEAQVLTYFQQRFKDRQKPYEQLRKSVIHNDANDHNVIVSSDLKNPEVLAAIDYGDAIYSQSLNDLAITCAYGIMDVEDPLAASLDIIEGYHSSWPILEEELSFLYDLIAMRLIITVTKCGLNKIKEPDNVYLQISDTKAWNVLFAWEKISADFAHYSMRKACDFPAHPSESAFYSWAKKSNFELSQMFPSRNSNDCRHVDLSVSSTWLGHLEEFSDFDFFEFKINKLQQEHPDKIIAGGYLEPRLVYTTEAYMKMGNERPESRTVHLGVDFWLPAGTPVHSFLDGEVLLAVNDEGDKEYGGLIILKHKLKELTFYTLYGHLSVESALARKQGDIVKPGDYLASLGDYPENGNWPPHLHFEILLSMLDFEKDFPGVAYHSEVDVWKSLCPDPNAFFKLKALNPGLKTTNHEIAAYRKQHLGKGMSLSYEEPLQMVRGMGAYLIDQFGTSYLDTVNNVAHVGHEHLSVVKAGQEQMALLNTNTRYLHQNITKLANDLLQTFPKQLEIVHFVNSGSEANELALRMAKIVTGQKDILASEMGYHGNTNACIEISSYKFDSKGGNGCPRHTHIFPMPDSFRGKYRGPGSGKKYAAEISKLIFDLKNAGSSPAAFIIEPIISCGGQVELPDGFLPEAYKLVREAGGLCISDEVQVGCGRMGSSFWGFEQHEVTPDIVTIGKPLGNGHPVAAVVCTKAVADAFANGMEFFNTFGGNPVSCAIASEVLHTVQREKLQENALTVGEFLKENLKEISQKYPIIKDVRGQGFFLGIELTDASLKPLPAQTSYLANRMKDLGMLMSVDGPDHNVLKIKPPMVFSKTNAQQLLYGLTKILTEDYMNI
ncbi:aminotransferase class III-fold pyridoxal phosphate-dependent enzyme [Lutimonas sp.]|uniref:aminotransferase class III-fold pyridoxal phosphate-dependent enzyme n=1 Tax=Lutimonas sp. TaxID=1872403 RepID=UPI003D9B0F6D